MAGQEDAAIRWVVRETAMAWSKKLFVIDDLSSVIGPCLVWRPLCSSCLGEMHVLPDDALKSTSHHGTKYTKPPCRDRRHGAAMNNESENLSATIPAVARAPST